MTNTVKTQRVKLTSKTGSFFNYLMSNNSSQPIVGEYATEMLYSDRHVYLVSEVSEDGEKVKLEILHTSADGENLEMGHQSWKHKPSGYFKNIEWRKDKWVTKSQNITWVDSFWDSIKDLNMGSEEYKNLTAGLWDENYNMVLVKGKTRVKTTYSRINVLFNCDNYHYDWSF